MVCDCPTMPKRGAVTSATRRSRSFLWPVIRACTGALQPSAAASAGTSCTRPSVIMIAPATRSRGTSDRAELSALNSRQPSVSPSASPLAPPRPEEPPPEPGNVREPFRQLRARGLCLLRAVAEFLARTLVDNHGGDRGERVAVLARQ